MTQGTKTLTTVSDQGGLFTFTDLPDGPAKLEIEMQGFSTLDADVTDRPEYSGCKVGTDICSRSTR